MESSPRQQSAIAEFIFNQLLALFTFGKTEEESVNQQKPENRCVFTRPESQRCESRRSQQVSPLPRGSQCQKSCQDISENQEFELPAPNARSASENHRELCFEQSSEGSENKESKHEHSVSSDCRPIFQRRESLHQEDIKAIAAAIIRKYERIEINRESFTRSNFIQVQQHVGRVPVCVN